MSVFQAAGRVDDGYLWRGFGCRNLRLYAGEWASFFPTLSPAVQRLVQIIRVQCITPVQSVATDEDGTI